MKKVCLLVVISLFIGMALSACGSSRPCPAYRSVDPRIVELPVSTTELPG